MDNTNKSKLDTAILLANRGFAVFPLSPNSKIPLKGFRWREESTNHVPTIKKWHEKYPDCNWGIDCGKSGIYPIDIDTKPGKVGERSYQQLDFTYGFDPTLTFITATGGRHLIYRHFGLGNTASKLGKDIDTRGIGGYIVGPGSVIDDKAYTISDNAPRSIAPLMPWVVEKLKEYAAGRRKENSKASFSEDNPADIERAKKWLLEVAEVAVEGDGGDHITFATAAKLREFGLSADTTFELMLDHWNDRCAPRWDIEDLKEKVENAYRYASRPQGAASATADFEPIDMDAQMEADMHNWNFRQFRSHAPQINKLRADSPERYARARAALQEKKILTGEMLDRIADRGARQINYTGELPCISLDDITLDNAQAQLVEGLINLGSICVLFGESHLGKSFFALALALHIARGLACYERAVTQGCAIYLAAEAADSIKYRAYAARKYHGLDNRKVPFSIVPCPIDLQSSHTDADKIIDLIYRQEEYFQQLCELIIVDTLAASFGDGDENAARDMNAFIANIRRIATRTGAALLVIHHSGKKDKNAARGHSSLKGTADTEMRIGKGRNEQPYVEVTKQRDGKLGEKFCFKLEAVKLDNNRQDAAVALLTASSVDAKSEFGAELTDKEKIALDLLIALCSGHDGSVSLKQWQESCNKQIFAQNKKLRPSSYRSTFGRLKNALLEKQQVEVDGQSVRPRAYV